MRWEKRITLQDGKPFQSRRICKEASAAEGSHPCCPSLRQSLARLQHCDRVLNTAFKKFEMIYLTRQHTGGFYPSNLAPLYSDCVPPSLDLTLVAAKIVQFNDTLSQPGGPPSSTVESRWSSLVETILFDEELFQLWLFSIRQQWDFPNVWPPLVEMTVFSRSNNLSTRSIKVALTGGLSWEDKYKRGEKFGKEDRKQFSQQRSQVDSNFRWQCRIAGLKRARETSTRSTTAQGLVDLVVVASMMFRWFSIGWDIWCPILQGNLTKTTFSSALPSSSSTRSLSP